jgi:uncharacterized membrane protein
VVAVLVAVAHREIGSMRQQHALLRFFRHAFSSPLWARRYFSKQALFQIEHAITESEKRHAGEIRFVVEAGLQPLEILAGKSPRQRAIELFGQLNIWDTEHNNGVLIYLLLADHDVEIVADRGIHRYVGEAGWEAICHAMELRFREGAFEVGVLEGIAAIDQALILHFPAQGVERNEIPNHPVVM